VRGGQARPSNTQHDAEDGHEGLHVARQVLMLQLAVHVHPQHISSQAQASAAAEDGRAAAGNSGSTDGSAASVAAAAAGDRAAATTEVMDQLAGLQQLVRAEAHKQQEVFDNTLKVTLQWLACMVVEGPAAHASLMAMQQHTSMQRNQHCSDR